MKSAKWYASVILLTLTATSAGGQALPSSEDCRDCHLTLEDERLAEPARTYESDVHAQTGFGCLACHGSGGQDDLNPLVGFLSVPERREIPAMCGRCHSDAAFMRQFNPGLRVDQVVEYWTSGHGQRLRDRNDPDVATCIDCHPAHRILPPSDPSSTVYAGNVVETCGSCHADANLMAGRDIGTTQVAEYSASVHGLLLLDEGDMTAPVCNDCHGNHGAAPPELSSIRNVCGQCHSVMADYFDQSAHVEIFEENDFPGCAACHDHHAIEATSDDLLNDRSAEVCFGCHEEADTLGHEFEKMSRALDSLALAAEHGRRTLEEAENLGMEVSQALFALEDVNNVQTRARSAIHTFHLGPVLEEVTAGLEIARRAEERGLEALAEHRFRRVGLGMFSGIVVLLIVGLLSKIRQLEAIERGEGP